MKLEVKEAQITEAGTGVLTPIQIQSHIFDSAHSPESATSTSLVFISSIEFFEKALAAKARGYIFLDKKLAEFKEKIPTQASAWSTPNIQLAMAKVLPLFNKKVISYPQGIHPTAVIHPEARVARSAHVGPYAVIQQHAVIGENAKIGANTVIEAYAEVGADSLIYPQVFIGAFCKVGSRCIIAPHVTIGSDGFGFLPDGKTNHKIPQIGNVIIEDDCEIGANCAIDRAALERTVIRRGTKLDNLCHIAHNVEIGENCLLAGAFKVAGSTKIGRNVMTSGNIDVNGHIEICDNVILTGRSGVTSSIKEPGMYGGFPAEPQKDNVKNMAAFTHLYKMRKQILKVLKHLNLEE